jgi:hypothetical protein
MEPRSSSIRLTAAAINCRDWRRPDRGKFNRGRRASPVATSTERRLSGPSCLGIAPKRNRYRRSVSPNLAPRKGSPPALAAWPDGRGVPTWFPLSSHSKERGGNHLSSMESRTFRSGSRCSRLLDADDACPQRGAAYPRPRVCPEGPDTEILGNSRARTLSALDQRSDRSG